MALDVDWPFAALAPSTEYGVLASQVGREALQPSRNRLRQGQVCSHNGRRLRPEAKILLFSA